MWMKNVRVERTEFWELNRSTELIIEDYDILNRMEEWGFKALDCQNVVQMDKLPTLWKSNGLLQ